MGKSVRFGLLLFVMTSATSGGALGQEADADAVAKLSAAFVLNFVRFTQWPDTAFEDESSPIRVAVIGEPAMLRYLRLLTADEQVQDRPVVVEAISPPRRSENSQDAAQEAERFAAAVRRAHAVFIASQERAHLDATLDAAAGRPILTIGDVPDFVDDRGMLGLLLRRNRMVFEANRTAIRSSGLRISSKVLKLAQRVREDER